MSSAVVAVWTDDYVAYDFGPQHPLKPIRVKLTVELARACGLFDRPNVTLLPPREATRAELEAFHRPEYLDAVERISHDVHGAFDDYGWGIGTTPAGNTDCPAFTGMHESSVLVCGGGLVAAEEVWRGRAEHSWYPAGGLHHAMADRASGFCIYNDPAVAIAWLLGNGAGRVAYVDVDVHHGDGVQAAFYDDPRVMTISLHESGAFLFPGTGFADEVGRGDAEGTSVNVALPPYTTDAAYRAAFDAIVPPLVESFKPDVLFTQLGCDTHATDPLAHFALTTRTYRWLAQSFHELAHDYASGRWVATGGGGYQIADVVPRAWTLYFAEQAEAELPDQTPPEWLEVAREHGATHLAARFRDPEVELGEHDADVRERAARAAIETRERIFPYHGISVG
ncbi:MAG TPA: acetoin utilization protein AcuC [Actinomycetota bacterium]